MEFSVSISGRCSCRGSPTATCRRGSGKWTFAAFPGTLVPTKAQKSRRVVVEQRECFPPRSSGQEFGGNNGPQHSPSTLASGARVLARCYLRHGGHNRIVDSRAG